MHSRRKRLGFCPVNDIQLFEFLQQFPTDHPLAGEPLRVGKPFPHAVRAYLVTVQGRTTAVTMSKDGLQALERGKVTWPELHQSLLRGLLHEEHSYVLRQGKVRPSQEVQRVKQEMLKAANDPPVGILHVDPIGETQNA